MKKNLFLLFSALFVGTGSMWADADLTISNVTEWQAFCSNVNNGTEYYSGKTVVLAEDIVMETSGFQVQTVGNSEANSFQGTFDGQGHTITYDFSGITKLNQVAPFRYIKNATIKNLKTAGTLGSDGTNMGGVVSTALGTCVIESCECGMAIISNLASGESNSGGIVGITIAGANLTVNNCIFSGSITVNNSTNRYCGIVGYLRDAASETQHTISNCLNIGTISGVASGTNNANVIYRAGGTTTLSNNYYLNDWGAESARNATQITNEKLQSGEVAYNLQGSQATQYWGQDLNDASSTPILTSDPAYRVFYEGDGKYRHWTCTISSTEDWELFSNIVAAGNVNLDVTMTANVDAGSTMVGTSSNPYAGKFDGKGYALKFIYNTGSGDRVAPFNYIKNATIKNLLTTGSISAGNVCAGIVGDALGENTITCCGSNITLVSTSRVGGLVGRCADSGASVAFSYCFFNGSLSSENANEANGLVGYNTKTVTTNYCLIAPTSVVNGNKTICGSTDPTQTNTYYYYAPGVSFTTNQGTEATTAQLNSGSLAYALNSGNTGILFFGQGHLNKSIVDNVPSLTSDASKKVYRWKPYGTGTYCYVNSNGAVPNPVRYGALAWDMNGTGTLITTLPEITEDKENRPFKVINKYVLTVSSAGATTLVLPFNTTSLPEGVKAYDITYTSGDQVTATPVDKITADKPVLINADEGTYTFEYENSSDIVWSGETVTNGALTGVYVQSNKSGDYNPIAYVPANSYVLQKQGDELGFYKVDAENTIKITSFRAYLTPQISPARSIKIVYNDDITGVENVNSAEVKAQKSGKYFENGKLVIYKNGMKFSAAGAQIK